MRFFSFDTQAKTYQSQAIAQKIFIQKLIAKLPCKVYGLIAELGCGGGELFEMLRAYHIEFERFLGCDSSRLMLDEFAPRQNVELYHQDFDEFLTHRKERFDLVCSSSALQWSHCFSDTLSLIARRAKSVALSVMSASSLRSLHRFLGTDSPLLEDEEIEESLRYYFDGEIYRSRVEIEFATPKEGLEHLKRSGMLGGGVLDFAKAKKMLDFDGKIEYESVNILGKPRKENI